MRTPPKPIIRKAFKKAPDGDLKQVKNSLSSLQDQLSAQPRILSHSENGKVPKGVRAHDRLMGRGARGTVLGVPDDQATVKSIEFPDSVTQYQDPQSGLVPPALAQFPTDGDFGWFRDTAGAVTYFTWNRSGTLYSIQDSPPITTLPFTSITGTITAAQHGDFTAIAANDNLHALATAARPGFLSAAAFTALVDILNTGTAANILNCTELQINGVKAIGTSAYNYTGGLPSAGPADLTYNAVERDMLNELKLAVVDIRAGLLAMQIFT